jgi:hypothetical protein
MIVLNETKGRPDQDALAKLIAEIGEETGTEGLAVLPYDESELESLLELADMSIEDELSDDLDDDLPEDVEVAAQRVTAKDILTLLGIVGLRKDEVERIYHAVEQWAFGRQDQEKPAYEDLLHILGKQNV